MGVIGDKKIIFCEGKMKSLDYQLLNRILSNLSVQNLTIVPAGSKFTFSIFAQGFFANNNEENPHFIIFRDRDFDAVPSDNNELIFRDSMLLSYRACVENYLIDANMIHAYWEERSQEKIENPRSSKWGHGNSPGIEAISEWIEQSARELKEYQSVRWALGELVLMTAARKNLETTWTEGSGHLPEVMDFQYCQDKAIEMIDQFRHVTDEITEECFRANLTKYQELFNQQAFWEQKKYTVWFHGKDLQKAMQKRENRYISLKNFLDWAVQNVDIAQHQDLLQLRQKILEI